MDADLSTPVRVEDTDSNDFKEDFPDYGLIAKTALSTLRREGYEDCITVKDLLEELRQIIINDPVIEQGAVDDSGPDPAPEPGDASDSRGQQDVNSKQEQAPQQVPKLRDGGQGLGLASSSSGASTNLGLQPDPQAVDKGLSVAGATYGAGAEQCSDRSPLRSKAVVKEKPFPQSLLLLENAYQHYCKSTVTAWKDHKHGRVLLMAQLAMKCQNAIRSIHGGEVKVCTGNLLMMCGDSHLLLTHDPTSNKQLHHKDYQNISEMDTFILKTVTFILKMATFILKTATIKQTSHEYEWATEFQTETKDCLECSIKCYKACLGDEVKLEKAFKRSVIVKHGNACSELGVCLMNIAENLASVKG